MTQKQQPSGQVTKCSAFPMRLLLRTAQTSKLKSMSAPCSLYPRKPEKLSNSGAIKELAWLRQHSQTLTEELHCLRSYDSKTQQPQFKVCKEWRVVGNYPDPHSQPGNQTMPTVTGVMLQPHASASISKVPHFRGTYAKAIPPPPPYQQMLTLEHSRYHHTNNIQEFFCPEGLGRSDHFQMARRWRSQADAA